MPEPTDHRAEAEAWLHNATEWWRGNRHPDEAGLATVSALIGIGYALLAGARGQEPETITHTRCPTEVTFGGDVEPMRCVRLPGHRGDHWLPFTVPGLFPLTSSEDT